MRLVVALMALSCFTGCGGTVVLQSRHPAPPPRAIPAPCHDCEHVDRDEAVRIVRNEAHHQHVGRLRIDDIERKKHDWRVEGRGVDACGHRVEIRARVHRRSGILESFQVKSSAHGRHRSRHDG